MLCNVTDPLVAPNGSPAPMPADFDEYVDELRWLINRCALLAKCQPAAAPMARRIAVEVHRQGVEAFRRVHSLHEAG